MDGHAKVVVCTTNRDAEILSNDIKPRINTRSQICYEKVLVLAKIVRLQKLGAREVCLVLAVNNVPCHAKCLILPLTSHRSLHCRARCILSTSTRYILTPERPLPIGHQIRRLAVIQFLRRGKTPIVRTTREIVPSSQIVASQRTEGLSGH